MRSLTTGLAFSLVMGVMGTLAGCATTPVLTQHADAARIAQLDAGVRRPAEEAHEKALADLERDSTRARERVAKAEAALKAGADTSLGDERVKKARIERAEAELRWQKALVDSLPWRRAVADAAFELAQATLLLHVGADVDLDAFRDQNAKLRHGLQQMDSTALRARSRFEEADRRFNEAKARYAQTLTAKPTTASTP